MSRPKIPDDLKREVRQRCAFGCVICRSPIYEYAHIIPWEEVRAHTYDNLVLLCGADHKKLDNKKTLTRDAVRESRARVEQERPATSSDLIEFAPYCIVMGSNRISTTNGEIFRIKEFGFLNIRLGEKPLINAKIFDAEGNVALTIENNEQSFSGSTWDINYVGNTIEIRSGARGMFIKIGIDANKREIHVTATLKTSYARFLRISDKGIYVGSYLLARENYASNCEQAIRISDSPPQGRNPMISAPGSETALVSDASFSGELFGTLDMSCLRNRYADCAICFCWTTAWLSGMDRKTLPNWKN